MGCFTWQRPGKDPTWTIFADSQETYAEVQKSQPEMFVFLKKEKLYTHLIFSSADYFNVACIC